MAGFEPTAFRSQSGRATKLRHTPSGATRRVHARRQRGCRISRAAGRTTPGAPPPRSLERPGRAAWKRPPPFGTEPTRTHRASKQTGTHGERRRPRRVAPRGRSDVGRRLASGTGPALDTRASGANGHARSGNGCYASRAAPRGWACANSGHRLREAPAARGCRRCKRMARTAMFCAGGRRRDRDRPRVARGEDAQGVRRTRFPGTGVRTRRSRLRRRVTSAAAPLRASVRPVRDARGRGRTEGVCDEGGRPGTMPSCRRSPDRGARCAGVAQW